MSAGLTAEQQLDVLWKALASKEFWISVETNGMILVENGPGNGVGRILQQLVGTRAEAIEQLNAMQVADRLEGKPVPAHDDQLDAFGPGMPGGYF